MKRAFGSIALPILLVALCVVLASTPASACVPRARMTNVLHIVCSTMKRMQMFLYLPDRVQDGSHVFLSFNLHKKAITFLFYSPIVVLIGWWDLHLH
jgi:hypothetical protein